MASVGTDGYVVLLAFVPGIGLVLGCWRRMPPPRRRPPPGGLELASADADGP